jgi:pimeloyl-ACP methyl ester carboxylesterase
LEFHSCFGDFECARLDVPLDWTASAKEQKAKRAAIAITKFPAKVSVIDSRYGGAILINPGGPGGSGVGLVIKQGKSVQTVVDSGNFSTTATENAGLLFDIIGFDPRGINNTTPAISCFPDDGARQFWAVQSQAQGMLSDNRTFPYIFGRTQALADSCSKILGHEGDEIGRFVSTPNVVQDMVAIIEALGEWRETKAKASVSYEKSRRNDEIIERTMWRKGEEKLLYWGFSYGTLLGATFASMHPSKVGRLVLDGVVDAMDYYSGEYLVFVVCYCWLALAHHIICSTPNFTLHQFPLPSKDAARSREFRI